MPVCGCKNKPSLLSKLNLIFYIFYIEDGGCSYFYSKRCFGGAGENKVEKERGKKKKVLSFALVNVY